MHRTREREIHRLKGFLCMDTLNVASETLFRNTLQVVRVG